MYKKELINTIVLFVCLELLTVSVSFNQFLVFALLGLVSLIIWAISSFITNSAKKVSKYSDEIIKIQFKMRWYQYFVVPILFYLSLVVYIFFVHQDFMRQVIILLGCFANFVLFVHTKLTYEKVFTFSRISKVAFDLINVIFFFIMSNILVVSGYFSFFAILLILSVFCLAIFIFNMQLSYQFSGKGLVIAIIFTLVLFVSGIYLEVFLFSRFAFLMTLIFYLLISFWHIRMSGERKIDKYLSPLLFALMALILIIGK